jgi:hypothetical protein
MFNLKQMLDALWTDYLDLNPKFKKIYDGLEARGEHVQNDHIAFRTIRHAKLGIDQLAKPFVDLGYKKIRDYHFKEKKLYAWHYEHADQNQPKIFISELLLEEFSPFCQMTLKRVIDSIPEEMLKRPDFCLQGRPWELSSDEYAKLAEESEYASWVAAFGFRPNHFTVLVNELKRFVTLPEVVAFVTSLDFKMNTSGGVIKGTPAEFLEQSSTMADSVSVRFSDRNYPVPACYYEFALRHPMPDGKLYQGFVASSADKIFESTHRS